ncbi:MAG: transposase [Gammaproteobacteria bacterium]|nr:transposase [Gammaproteobacteria bacterium]
MLAFLIVTLSGNPQDAISGYQDEFMMEMFMRHCHKWVQIDSTHNVSRYDLKLVVVLVGDDNDYGVPGLVLK